MKQPRSSSLELTTQKSESTVRTCVSPRADSAAASLPRPHGRSFAARDSPENAVGAGVGDGDGDTVGDADADGSADGEGVGSGSSTTPPPSVTQNVSSV